MTTRLSTRNGNIPSRRSAGAALLSLLGAAPLLLPATLPFLTAALPLLTSACTRGPGKNAPPPIVLATTTSTYDSGLLDDIIPPFEKASGMTVKLVVVGSGKAMTLGERGEADLLLVHSPAEEEAYMAHGAGALRRRMMYNDFVLVGPAADPAGVRGATSLNAAMRALHRPGTAFVSRGDGSGTHEMELGLWTAAGLSHPKDGYLESGQGMGSTLRTASEQRAYTLTDRGTFLALQSRLYLEIVFQGDPALRNVYHVIVVDPKRGPRVNEPGAVALARYLLSAETLARVGEFGRDRFGQALFFPDAEPFDAATPARGAGAPPR